MSSTTNAAKVPVSIIIPTKDEERNIAACLESLEWADERIVFDSYSTDRTLEIAEHYGPTIVQRVFDNFSAHKNWALENIELRNKWVFIVDADERATPALAEEIRETIASADALNGYHVARQYWLWNKSLRAVYPDYNLRLIQHGKAFYEDRIVHEHMVVEGPSGFLKNHLIHEDDKGMERWFDRHNKYSTMEAFEAWKLLHQKEGEAGEGSDESISSSIEARGPERRRALKQFAYRHLPCRPIFQFLYLYVFKLGFLDGRKGFRYAVLKMFYEYQISLKIEELEVEEARKNRAAGISD